MTDKTPLRQAGEWLRATNFVVDWCATNQPPLPLWEAFIEAIQVDPTGWHDGDLTYVECWDWLESEAGYDFSADLAAVAEATKPAGQGHEYADDCDCTLCVRVRIEDMG